MTSQEGSTLLKSCVRRSFSFTCGNLQTFATHFWVASHGLRNTGLDNGYANIWLDCNQNVLLREPIDYFK